MSKEPFSVAGYLAVLAVLVVLTIVTVGVSFLELPAGWHIAAGLTIAAVKATFVVLFFMHALASPRLTWCVIVVSIGWIGLMFSLTCSDYLTRAAIPFVPGH